MKTKFTLIALTLLGVFFTGCSSDDDSPAYNPFEHQEKRPIYPSALSFKSVTNNGVTTTEDWTFAYNNDNTISSYTYKYTEKSTNDDIDSNISETISGTLSYRNEWDGSKSILNNVTATYTNITKNGTLNRNDTYTETVAFNGSLIESITTRGERIENNIQKTISNKQTFTYDENNFCTGSIYSDNEKTITGTYSWGSDKLNNVTVYTQNNDNNGNKYKEYSYTYHDTDLASDYGFNMLAFVYGHNPRIYAAMNLFGKTTPYLLKNEEQSGYSVNNGKEYPEPDITRDYTIIENHKSRSVTYFIDSPTYDEYQYKFSTTTGAAE